MQHQMNASGLPLTPPPGPKRSTLRSSRNLLSLKNLSANLCPPVGVPGAQPSELLLLHASAALPERRSATGHAFSFAALLGESGDAGAERSL